MAVEIQIHEGESTSFLRTACSSIKSNSSDNSDVAVTVSPSQKDKSRSHSRSAARATSTSTSTWRHSRARRLFGLGIVVGVVSFSAASIAYFGAVSGAWDVGGSGAGDVHVHSVHTFVPKTTSTSVTPSESVSARDVQQDVHQYATDGLYLTWLMSFPNSGTTYTLEMVGTVTKHSTATNYGYEFVKEDGKSVPVFNSSAVPVWDLSINSSSPPTSGYVLTKTHCGGYCMDCNPIDHTRTQSRFLKQCLTGMSLHNKHAKGSKVTYEQKLVKRAVHLIRNPFDNIVSRFNFMRKQIVERNHTSSLEAFPNSRKGFRDHCLYLKNRHLKAQKKSGYINNRILDRMIKVPCYDGFFQYIDWHNHAFTTTWGMGVPALVVHYENYTSNFNGTVTELLEFLERLPQSDPPPFFTGKVYSDFFTREEMDIAASVFEDLANVVTWKHIAHYFDF